MEPPWTSPSLARGGKRRRITSTTGLVLLGLYALFALDLTTSHIGRRRTFSRESGRRRTLLHKHRKKGEGDFLSISNVTESEHSSRKKDENAFMHRVESLLRNDTSSTAAFAVVILSEGKVYCRQSQTKTLLRARHFVQMLQHGLARYQTEKLRNNLPIIIKHDDSSGCYPKTMVDKYSFPRLTWSVPAGNRSWCQAIGMPSYKVWREAKKGGGRDRKLLEMARNEIQYPWPSKISKAVWRGSATYNRALFGYLPLTEIPRAKLVRESLGAVDLIDAGFHKHAGNYSTTNLDEDMFKSAMPLNKMMNYKGT